MGKHSLSVIETSGEREREIFSMKILEACPALAENKQKVIEVGCEINRRPDMQPTSGLC